LAQCISISASNWRDGFSTFRSPSGPHRPPGNFRSAWREHNYQAIVRVAQRLPAAFLEEDPQLQMYYDNAQDRIDP